MVKQLVSVLSDISYGKPSYICCRHGLFTLLKTPNMCTSLAYGLALSSHCKLRCFDGDIEMMNK